MNSADEQKSEKGRRMLLKVIKSDGTVEDYMHTKVLGTINNGLALTKQANIFLAEQVAEAITYHLYDKTAGLDITSNRIYLIIQIVLKATGFEDAAAALSEYYYRRKLKRRRIEVVENRLQDFSGRERLCRNDNNEAAGCKWDKSKIISDLVKKGHLDRQTARVIASAVEQKVMNLGTGRVSRPLIKQLVLDDMTAILRAQAQLQLDNEYNANHTDTDVCLRQQQKGLCTVGVQ